MRCVMYCKRYRVVLSPQKVSTQLTTKALAIAGDFYFLFSVNCFLQIYFYIRDESQSYLYFICTAKRCLAAN
jgi:hypothetical protein